MLQPPRLTVWSSIDELKSLKSLLFEQSDGHDNRPRALEIIRAWSTRGRLPHAIESTAQIIECILYDTPRQSELMVRMGYSTAVCRFVNGLLDPAQKSHFAVSMYNLAQAQGLPASFVDIRHAATHEALPPLGVLRATCSNALDWLWEHYWKKIDSSNGGSNGLDNDSVTELEEARIAKFQDVLSKLEDLKKGNRRKTGKRQDEKDERVEAGFCAEISKILQDAVSDIQFFVEILVQEYLLVMEQNGNALSIYKTTEAWKPLIRHLDTHVEGFTSQLFDIFLDEVQEESETGPTDAMDEFGESETEFTYQWLEFLMSLLIKGKIAGGSESLLDGIVSQCILSQNTWCIRLAEYAIGQSNSLESKYSQACTSVKKQIVKDPRPKSTSRVPEPQNFQGSDINSEMDLDRELEIHEARLKQMQAQREQWRSSKMAASSKQGPGILANGVIDGAALTAPKGKEAPKFLKVDGTWASKPIGTV